MIQRCTVAVKDKRRGDGIVFMNLPMVVGEKIFIHGGAMENRLIKIGLTNKDPNQIRLQDERENILREVMQPKCNRLKVRFYACISLNRSGSLEINVPSCYCLHHVLFFANLSTNSPIWLVFVLPEGGRFVEISKQELTHSSYKHSRAASILNNFQWLFS